MLLGSLGLVAIFAVIVRQQLAMATMIMTLGALLWVVGNGFWLAGRPLAYVVSWWSGFLVLTIVGERLELSRMLRLSWFDHGMFLLAVSVFLVGLLPPHGLCIWYACHRRRDGRTGVVVIALRIARRTVRQTGLTRFIAVCLLSGYVWLGVSGILTWYFAGMLAGPYYDAMLHTVFVGFVMAMIFGHAPIILPALLGRTAAPYHRAFYVPLVLLHASLLLRTVGDLLGWWPGRQWGGLFNAVAILLFLITLVWVLWRRRIAPHR